MILKRTRIIYFSFVTLALGASLIGCGSSNSGGFELAKDMSESDSDNSATVASNAKHTGPVIKDTVTLPAGRKIKK